MSCPSTPYDNFFYKLSEPAAKVFHSLKMTPNTVTLLRLLLIILCFFLIYRGVPVIIPIVLYIINFYLDCVDGTMARKYNQQSKFGQYFDSIVDVFTMCGFAFLLLLCRNCIPRKVIVFIALYWCIYVVTRSLNNKGYICASMWASSAFPVAIISIIIIHYYSCAQVCYKIDY